VDVVVDGRPEPPLKRQRAAAASGAMFARHLTQRVVVKQEEFAEKDEEFLDEQEEHHTMRTFSLRQQDKIAELVDIALAGGGDAIAVKAIRDRH